MTGSLKQYPLFFPIVAISSPVSLPVCLFIVLSKTSYMPFCYYCDILAFLVAAWLLNCFLIFWHLGLPRNTDRNHRGMIMNLCAVCLRWISPPLTYFCITRRHANKPFLILTAILIFSGRSCYCICRHAVYSSEKPSAEVVCFSSACRSPGTLLHMAVLYQLSDAHRKPSVSRCPPHRDGVCVFAPGSLSARSRIMGRAGESLLFSSPHYSFGKTD